MNNTLIELAPNHKRGLALKRPLLNAAGTLGFAGEARGLADLTALGAFVTNPLTWTPRTPAAAPNAVELTDGVLIHTGLPNPGVRAALRQFAREWERRLSRAGVPVVVHLAATTPDDVGRALEALDRDERVGGVELGLREDVDESELIALVRRARGGPPLLVRLPVARAAELCRAAVQAGADALTVGAPTRLSVEAGGRTVTGRVYGPGQFAAAVEAVRAVTAALAGSATPIIGAGGVFSVENADAMRAAGAVAVQLDAVLWQEPGVLRRWEADGQLR